MLFKSMPCGKPLFFPSKQYITTVFYSFVGTVVGRYATLDLSLPTEWYRLGAEPVNDFETLAIAIY